MNKWPGTRFVVYKSEMTDRDL